MKGSFFKIKCWIEAFKCSPAAEVIIYAAEVASFRLLKLTRGARLGPDNVAGIIRGYLEITSTWLPGGIGGEARFNNTQVAKPLCRFRGGQRGQIGK